MAPGKQHPRKHDKEGKMWSWARRRTFSPPLSSTPLHPIPLIHFTILTHSISAHSSTPPHPTHPIHSTTLIHSTPPHSSTQLYHTHPLHSTPLTHSTPPYPTPLTHSTPLLHSGKVRQDRDR
ncbi:hypothetical protein Pmani_012443 [Petrolisthes manimaculis]|uniref:Uncharacterized protein n=1 Tax=Petrolisthes manimaculis TaxID=1843537 RepID=A0AAE1PXU5_9EUCA|nr:hypothetical protein Pmani_012443 [Petrolisthes manimaculis]